MKFVSMLNEDLVVAGVQGSTRREVYKNMLSRLCDYAELELDAESTVDEMLERENATGVIFPDLAMPHVRIEGLHDLFVVIGLPENPDAMGIENPADMVFMSLIGEDMSDVYFKMLSTLARHLTNADSAQAMLAAARGGREKLWEYFQQCNITLRTVVTAEDVMTPANVVLKSDAPLSDAFDLFSTTHRRFLPVVDAEGKFAGELSARKVIRKFFPEYVFMMDNLNFLNDFAVFNEIFHSEHALPVSEYMNTEAPCAGPNTPLIQLTLLLTKQGAGDVYIVNDDNVLLGVFSIDNIVSKILRG